MRSTKPHYSKYPQKIIRSDNTSGENIIEITRLKKENYDELIALLNEVFSNHNKRESDFEKDLPKMCVRDDEHMQKHFGIFADGRLVAAIGV